MTAPATSELLALLGKGLLVQALSVAARLRIPELLAEGPRSAAELAEATGATEDGVERVCRALAGLEVLEQDTDGRFRLGRLGSALGQGPGAVGALAALAGSPVMWTAWGELWHGVTTGGRPFRRAFGAGLFEHLSGDPEAAAGFHAWMTQQSELQVTAILAAYDFSGFRTIVDVGGGHGSLLAAILETAPGARGVLFDRPDVIERADYVRRPGIAGRCDVAAGDFFESVPAGGDCYVMKLIVHDWDDEHALRVLRSVRSAIGEGGTLLLAEFVMPDGPGYHHAQYMDLNMLVLTEGGRERTEDEYRSLLAAAGFALQRVVPTGTPLALVVALEA